jgi:hypothetical protein
MKENVLVLNSRPGYLLSLLKLFLVPSFPPYEFGGRRIETGNHNTFSITCLFTVYDYIRILFGDIH